jgi:hypothetical protein
MWSFIERAALERSPRAVGIEKHCSKHKALAVRPYACGTKHTGHQVRCQEKKDMFISSYIDI